jgi:beta-lactamase superfamily II metal-dependent hydrolase
MRIPEQPTAKRRPWLPACLPESMRTDVAHLHHVVVDEIVRELVTLHVSPWPEVDEHGRVRFDRPSPDGGRPVHGHLLVHRQELADQLYAGWLDREPRVGDVFAAELAPDVGARLDADGDAVLDEGTRLADVLPGRVADLTGEARNVAKQAFYAAIAGVQPYEQAMALGQVVTLDQVAALHQVGAPAVQPAPQEGRVRAGPWAGPRLRRDAAADEPAACRWSVPADRVGPPGGGLLAALRDEPTALFYFLLNVGDGDSQLLLLPLEPGRQRRRAIVVDAGTTGKLTHLMAALAAEDVLPPAGGPDEVCALVVATHPHDDHIEGLPELLRAYGAAGIGDFWEPGYYATTGAFAEMMAAVEDCRIRHCEPVAGMVRYIGGVRASVLAPSVALRTAYDTYGVDCNDASLVLKLEHPAVRIAAREDDGHQRRTDLGLPEPWSIVLGADAQTRSWSHVSADFPPLHRGSDADLHRELREAQGRDHLAAHVLKVSHHASKHGINIELVERMQPRVTLISSVGGGGRYGFPHALATQAIAEALAPSTRSGSVQPRDADLGIHYTGGLTEDGTRLGSIALLVPARRRSPLRMWRFADGPRDDVELSRDRTLSPVYVPG